MNRKKPQKGKGDAQVKNQIDTEFVENVSSWDSGGGTILDVVTLKNGKVIAISGEVVVLYDSMEDLVSGDSHDRPSIVL
jgi:hypothetical protein